MEGQVASSISCCHIHALEHSPGEQDLASSWASANGLLCLRANRFAVESVEQLNMQCVCFDVGKVLKEMSAFLYCSFSCLFLPEKN